ncbi:MAG: hypothetical protein AB1446_03090 [Bacillota bacterium]
MTTYVDTIMLVTGGKGMEDTMRYSENQHLWAKEWFPHRLVVPERELPGGEDALMMWDLIVQDFLASLPLED